MGSRQTLSEADRRIVAAWAAGLAAPDRPGGYGDEVRLQLNQMSPPVRAALRRLPPVGADRSGPLGPGLLAARAE